MTPQEQQLVADLFDRLASLESQRRDPDAERLDSRRARPARPIRFTRWCSRCWCRTKPSSAPMPELKSSSAPSRRLPRAAAASLTHAQTRSWDATGHGPQFPPCRPENGFEWRMGRGARRKSAPSGPARISTGVSARRTADGRPHGRRRQLVSRNCCATVAGVVGGAMLLDGIRSMMGGHHSFGR